MPTASLEHPKQLSSLEESASASCASLQRGQIVVEDLSGELLALSYLATAPLARLEERPTSYRSLLICLHQTPSHAESFQALARALATRIPALFILAFDTPGFGESEPLSVERPTLEALAAPILSAIRCFREAHTFLEAHLCGHHTGASLALALGEQLGRVASSLILIGLPALPTAARVTYLRYTQQLRARVRVERSMFEEMSEGRAPLFEALRAELQEKDDGASPAVIERELKARLEAGERLPDIYEAVFTYDHTEAMSRIQSPILLIAPQSDRLSAFTAYQLELMSAVGREGSAVEVSGGGYILDAAPEAIAETLITWFLPLTNHLHDPPEHSTRGAQ